MPPLPPFIQQALELAQLSVGLSEPNPRVGCVITKGDRILGVGHTQRAGDAHAEIMAMRQAASRGEDIKGATAWVTLEPCAHHGRTPPCCDALAAAGIRKVVASVLDPNPLVAGQGFGKLRAAGIEVEAGPGEDETRELNIGFFSRMERNLPWVRMKIAASLDGKTALDNGASQWITSPDARKDGHAWRARATAVLTGIGTVLEDNPRLDVRDVPTPHQPFAVIVDSKLETPPDAHMFVDARPLLIYTASPEPNRRAMLQDRGATVIEMPDANGKVDLEAMMRDLAAREVNELHIEAGHKLNGSLVRGGLVDELLVYFAPKLLGAGRDMANIGPFTQLDQALPLHLHSVTRCGPDIRVIARVTRP
ncbi:MAG TPA: bifunctional diaminohydroxyphosphoribosylaminopyrimidine deaminase/5-amino-6-(5-phosphoribosylamino)uracil reductase RibD [Ramlibacter sp.]|nr:bifunctional diaminohydroxyphosphoribosylaminopyrimidine deaminase/5-amino-6-(5-phosphoribosylamino)uracil reductase RibD [Ramlibacter sp.]